MNGTGFTPGLWIDRIRINRILPAEREGRRFWIKQRRPWAGAVAGCANAFFRAAGNPVVVLGGLAQWQEWEVASYRLLHEWEGYAVFAEGPRAVWAQELPGRSLDRYAAEGGLSESLLQAAAREMARAHACTPAVGAPRWSHGDAHMGNFIYDGAGRARLIDFEVAHRPGMAEAERHADDLLVFLQDLMSHDDRATWLSRASCFLGEYLPHAASPGLPERLLARLAEPRTGVGRLWWGIRTAYLPRAEQEARVGQLGVLLRELS